MGAGEAASRAARRAPAVFVCAAADEASEDEAFLEAVGDWALLFLVSEEAGAAPRFLASFASCVLDAFASVAAAASGEAFVCVEDVASLDCVPARAEASFAPLARVSGAADFSRVRFRVLVFAAASFALVFLARSRLLAGSSEAFAGFDACSSFDPFADFFIEEAPSSDVSCEEAVRFEEASAEESEGGCVSAERVAPKAPPSSGADGCSSRGAGEEGANEIAGVCIGRTRLVVADWEWATIRRGQ